MLVIATSGPSGPILDRSCHMLAFGNSLYYLQLSP
jgi:hypothetical protein